MSKDSKLTPGLYDPDPLSFALVLFSAVIPAAGLVVQVVENARQRKLRLSAVRASLIKRLNSIDRALNRLDEAYRSLVSIYDELGLLSVPFLPGKRAFVVDRPLKTELERLRSVIFSAGKDLEDGLSSLATLLTDGEVDHAIALSNAVDDLFRNAINSKRLFNFFIELGKLVQFVSEFVYSVAARHDFRLTSNRAPLLAETIQRLQDRLKSSRL